MKQQKPKPIIAVVAPASGDGQDSPLGGKQRPVVVLLNDPSALDHDDDDEFDLSSLLGNFEPGDKNKVDYFQPELKPQMSEDGFEGGVAQAQYEPPGEEPDFIQPEVAPVVIPGPIAVDKVDQPAVPVAADEPIVVLADEPAVIVPIAEVAQQEPIVSDPVEQKAEEPAKIDEPVAAVEPEPVKVFY